MTSRVTYTVEEAGALLGISRGSAYAAAKRGDIPTLRINRRLLVPKAAFERLVGLASGPDPSHTTGVESTDRE